MYKKGLYTVMRNERIAPKTWVMVLGGDTQYLTAPGQFVNLAVDGKYLRRPISLCDYDDHTITLLYDVVGEGTVIMSRAEIGDTFDVLTGLGNGFQIEKDRKRPLLLGGGIGVAPLLRLARDLRDAGQNPIVALGFNTTTDVVLAEDFEALGLETYISTVDGTRGVRGFVTDIVKGLREETYDYYYACGPTPMLRAVAQTVRCDGQLSLDERMGCGFGACMCCSIETTRGSKRVCKEGPVFRKEELIWK